MKSYLVPDYYDKFKCKCGSCRSACCKGWGISVSMTEYFNLLGMECKNSLRRRLDVAFHMADEPSAERYALLTHNWQGDCPLRAENGLCELQLEKGENALPAICRVYPRGAHAGPVDECALSGSCEGVIEILLNKKEQMDFKFEDLGIITPTVSPLRDEGAVSYYRALRRASVLALQDRRHHIAERMMYLGRVISAISDAEKAGDHQKIAEMTDDFLEAAGHGITLRPYGVWVTDAMEKIAETFAKNSENLSPYWEDGALNLKKSDYKGMRREFEEKYPDWETFFEQITVNHVFFSRFPFSDIHESMWDEYRALCAAHCIIMFLATIYTFGKSGSEPLADVTAAAFRMIEHSDFDRRGAIVCARMGIDTQEKLDELLCSL